MIRRRADGGRPASCSSATGCCKSLHHRLCDLQWQVLLGGLMGDGALSPSPERPRRAVPLGPWGQQTAYGDWKASMFANIGVSRSHNAKGAVFHDVHAAARAG